MQFKIFSKKVWSVIILTEFFISVGLFFSLTKLNHSSPIAAPVPIVSLPTTTTLAIFPEQEQPNTGLPIRLKIPAISVDAAVEQVGLTASGAVDTPKNQDNVAWFKLGQIPGAIGSAVMDGHYGWKKSKPSVFDNLYKLSIGDEIYVEDEKGVVTTFVVREKRRYDPTADAVRVFTLKDEKSHLNLITCEGDWDKDSKNYSRRLVVFADKQ